MITFEQLFQTIKKEIKSFNPTHKNDKNFVVDRLKYVLQPSTNFMKIRTSFVNQIIPCEFECKYECDDEERKIFELNYDECKKILNELDL
jgi:hypothetical protein